MSKPTKIALLCGGYSEEASVSLAGIDYLKEVLDGEDVQFTTIVLASPDDWHALVDGEKYPIERGDFSVSIHGKKETFDLAHIHIHGTPGEDGKLQQYFEAIGMPYLGTSAFVSSVTFNKHLTRLWAENLDVDCSAGFFIPLGTKVSKQHIPTTLSYPQIVKPNEGGSSIGISLVDNENDLLLAMQSIVQHDGVLVERFVKGREFSVGVGKNLDGEVIVLPITEIKPHNAFFDYDAKYNAQSEEITPAQIAPTLQQHIEQKAKDIYLGFSCSFFVRMEFIWSEEEQKLYFLEVNTIPGFSRASILPQQIAVSGLNFKAVYRKHIAEVLLTRK